MQPGVAIYTSNRLEDLLAVLAARLAKSPLPPLDSETILVPGQGMARWLRFELARRHGIAAGLELPFPGAFVQQLGRRADGADADPFAPGALLFRIHRLLCDVGLQRDLGPAQRYCENDPDGRKRFQLSQRLASCFDDYQLYRSDLLTRAATGDDLEDCGVHGPWQARLWRALLHDAGQTPKAAVKRGRARREATGLLFRELAEPEDPAGGIPPAHRLARLQQALADPERAALLLPRRLSVFGAPTLAPAFLALLTTIARTVPVVLYVPTPTAHWFGDQKRRAAGPGNSLLSRLGTEARDFQQILDDLPAGERRDLHVPDPPPPRRLLHCLQQDIAAVSEHGADAPPFQLTPDDDSVRVHDCHSALRELEVVRDQILAAFADDPSLEPHDVLVLVPDIERYAPYAHAVFGPVVEHLPFQVADKSPRSESPLCAVVFHVLRLSQGRLPVFDVLHLLEEPAVQRRFGLFAGDLPLLRHLCERAGIRWGADGETRAQRFHVPPFEDNSWSAGLRRMILGVATGPTDDLVLGLLPAGDRTSGREDLLERLLDFTDTVFVLVRSLQRPRSLAQWADEIDRLAGELFLPTGAADEQAMAELRRASTELRAIAGVAAHLEPVSIVVLQDWLESALGRAAASQGFLGGKVTIAAMLPMRAVPVRQLFLCGLDDQAFPRRDTATPFDLVASHRRPGDRSARLDDRQLFLDCLLAAREKLHITHIGHSQRDDSECAPSVVLAELLDTLDRCCLPPAGFETPRRFVQVRHPLQQWSARYRSGADARLFTFSPAIALAGADVTAADEPPFCAGPLPLAATPDTEAIALEQLARFWWHPCRFFLRSVLQLRLPRRGDSKTTTEPFVVDNLERWRLLDTALERALHGKPPPRDPLAHARATGRLPVGGVGAAAFAQIDELFAQFFGDIESRGELRSQEFELVGPDFTIRGELAGIGKDELVYVRAGSLGPKDRLRAWLFHVIAAILRDRGHALPATTVMITRASTEFLRQVPPADAMQHLTALVEGYRQGQLEPLPVFEHSSEAFGKALHDGKPVADAMRTARTKWLPSMRPDAPPQDSEDESIALCMRGRDALALPGFAHWAERLWTAVHGYTGKA